MPAYFEMIIVNIRRTFYFQFLQLDTSTFPASIYIAFLIFTPNDKVYSPSAFLERGHTPDPSGCHTSDARLQKSLCTDT